MRPTSHFYILSILALKLCSAAIDLQALNDRLAALKHVEYVEEEKPLQDVLAGKLGDLRAKANLDGENVDDDWSDSNDYPQGKPIIRSPLRNAHIGYIKKIESPKVSIQQQQIQQPQYQVQQPEQQQTQQQAPPPQNRPPPPPPPPQGMPPPPPPPPAKGAKGITDAAAATTVKKEIKYKIIATPPANGKTLSFAEQALEQRKLMIQKNIERRAQRKADADNNVPPPLPPPQPILDKNAIALNTIISKYQNLQSADGPEAAIRSDSEWELSEQSEDDDQAKKGTLGKVILPEESLEAPKAKPIVPDNFYLVSKVEDFAMGDLENIVNDKSSEEDEPVPQKAPVPFIKPHVPSKDRFKEFIPIPQIPKAAPPPQPEPVPQPLFIPEPVPQPLSIPEPVPQPLSIPEPEPQPLSIPEPVPQPLSIPEPVPQPLSIPEPVPQPVEQITIPPRQNPAAEPAPTTKQKRGRARSNKNAEKLQALREKNRLELEKLYRNASAKPAETLLSEFRNTM